MLHSSPPPQCSFENLKLTKETRLTILISKLTFWIADASLVGSIDGIVNSQAETYMMGAETKVLITIPEVICNQKLR